MKLFYRIIFRHFLKENFLEQKLAPWLSIHRLCVEFQNLLRLNFWWQFRRDLLRVEGWILRVILPRIHFLCYNSKSAKQCCPKLLLLEAHRTFCDDSMIEIILNVLWLIIYEKLRMKIIFRYSVILLEFSTYQKTCTFFWTENYWLLSSRHKFFLSF